ncbi:MAG TPA: hypothetical protein VHZ51_21815 [Ktedonobacteraceae bacterium]|nr:hypothetical protein [Ktedonobacteraceae bacterium]
MKSPVEMRKVIGGVILAVLFVCMFLFIKSSLVIDWDGSGTNLTPLLPILAVIGILVIVFYHIIYKSSAETNKLSWTAILTVIWLAIIIFYPFKDPNNTSSGTIGFFTLVAGLAVCVLWVRFFADDIITTA